MVDLHPPVMLYPPPPVITVHLHLTMTGLGSFRRCRWDRFTAWPKLAHNRGDSTNPYRIGDSLVYYTTRMEIPPPPIFTMVQDGSNLVSCMSGKVFGLHVNTIFLDPQAVADGQTMRGCLLISPGWDIYPREFCVYFFSISCTHRCGSLWHPFLHDTLPSPP